MATLADLIAAHQERETLSTARNCAITPRGLAEVYLARLTTTLPDLGVEGRADVADRLRALLADLDAATWAQFGGALADREPRP